MKKRFLCLLLVILILLTVAPCAMADGYVHITDSADARINSMLSAIECQNFGNSGTNAEKAKQLIYHVLYNSSFAVFGEGQFNYSNAGSYTTVVSDGTYDVHIRGAKGCFALASYVTNLIYGEAKGTEGLDNKVGNAYHSAESFKKLILTEAQAGEHMRINDKHSVAFISADANGFYCISYQDVEGNTAELEYWTYEAFVNKYSGYQIGIFNANTAKNTPDSGRTDHEHRYENGVCSICGYVLANPFIDIDSNSLYYDAVLWMYGSGITKGYTATEYNVGGECTRGQVVAFLWREAGCPEPREDSVPFSDVHPQAYYYKAVTWASEQGIVKGYSDGTFGPNNTVTRAQFITFLWRMEGQPKPDLKRNPYIDVTENDFYKAILWGTGTGVVLGYGDGCFKPDDPCTRGHVALFMYRNFA